MNYLIQRGKVRNQMINVPNGLPELLSDITREVLRCQPTTECLCQFIIDYLHSVIVTREKAKVAKGIIDRALTVVDEIIADMCVCDISKEKAEEMALHMEQCFRRFLTRMRCEQRSGIEIVSFDEIYMLDEMIKRCKFTEQELKVSKPMIEAAYRRFVDAYMKARDDFEGTEELYQYFKGRDLRRQEAEKQKMAAKKIQATFRGYKVRKSINKTLSTEQEAAMKIQLEQDFEEVLNHAAVTIQRAFRRYMNSFGSLKDQNDAEICDPGSDVKIRTPDTADGLAAQPAEQTLEEEFPVEIEEEAEIKADQEPGRSTDVDQEPVTEPAPPEVEEATAPEPEPVLRPGPEAEAEPEQSAPPAVAEAVEEAAAEDVSPNEGEAAIEG